MLPDGPNAQRFDPSASDQAVYRELRAMEDIIKNQLYIRFKLPSYN